MTGEEAWRRTKGYLYDVLSGEEADEIIKALEQEPTLDKIRGEIRDLAYYVDGEMMIEVINLQRVLEIIDKFQNEGGYFGTVEYEITDIEMSDTNDVLDKIRAEIEDTGAYEQEVNGKTEFLKGINYCLGIIDKYKAESEE